MAAEFYRPGFTGVWRSGSVAGCGSRASLRVQHCRWQAAGRARLDRMAPLPARPGPAGPGPPEYGHPDLRAGRWKPSRCPACCFRRPSASCMWAWPKWPTSGTSSTAPSGMPPRASRWNASSSPGTSLTAGQVTLACIGQAAGDLAGALEASGEAAGMPRRSTAGLLYPAPAQRARLLLVQGDVAAAARWADESGLHAEDEPRYPRGAGISGAGPGAAGRGSARQGARVAGPAARGGGRPGPDRQRDRGRRAAGAGAGRLRPGRRRRSPPWPRRSRWPARRAMSGSSPTRARRWPRCWPG